MALWEDSLGHIAGGGQEGLGVGVAVGEKTVFWDHSEKSSEDPIVLWDSFASYCSLLGGFGGEKQAQRWNKKVKNNKMWFKVAHIKCGYFTFGQSILTSAWCKAIKDASGLALFGQATLNLVGLSESVSHIILWNLHFYQPLRTGRFQMDHRMPRAV